VQTALQRQTAIVLAEALVVAYMAIIAFAAHRSGVALLLFPELAALSHDVMTRPRGKWATQPWRLILTPTLTAAIGLFITRHTHYSAIAIAVAVLLALLVIKLLRSAIGPAISAGALPIVLGEKSWMYPVAISIGLAGLVAVLLLWQRFGPHIEHPSPRVVHDSEVIDALEAYPNGHRPDRFWVFTLLVFVLGLGAAARFTGLRFILFPPLIVMAYEIFGHPEVPGWMARPIWFPLVCFLTASIGWLACDWIHPGFVAVMIATLCSVAVLRAFKVHMPPALAVGLLPFVMATPDFRYSLSVGIGTAALTLCFWARQSFQRYVCRQKQHRASLVVE